MASSSETGFIVTATMIAACGFTTMDAMQTWVLAQTGVMVVGGSIDASGHVILTLQNGGTLDAGLANAVVAGTSPIIYTLGTRTVSIQPSSNSQDGSMSAAQALALSTLTGNQALRLLNQSFTVPLLIVGGSSSTNYTVSGAAVGHAVVVNVRASNAIGPQLYGWVSSANTITIEARALVSIGAATFTIDIHVIP